MKFLATFILTLAAATIIFAQAEGRLSGKVENESGKAFAGVKVTVRNRASRANKELTTDNDGKFSFALAPGEYTVSFDAVGYQTASLVRSLTVTEGKTTSVETVRLAKEEAYSLIRGRVYNGDGFSLTGVKLVIERIDGGAKFKQEKESNSAGTFAFRLPGEAGKYRVTATLKGFKAESKEVEIERGEARNLAITLQKN